MNTRLYNIQLLCSRCHILICDAHLWKLFSSVCSRSLLMMRSCWSAAWTRWSQSICAKFRCVLQHQTFSYLRMFKWEWDVNPGQVQGGKKGGKKRTQFSQVVLRTEAFSQIHFCSSTCTWNVCQTEWDNGVPPLPLSHLRRVRVQN